MLASSFPPAIKNSWYDTNVDIAGPVPDSFHDTDKADPPVKTPPGAGVMNWTSAEAMAQRELNAAKRWSRMVGEVAQRR